MLAIVGDRIGELKGGLRLVQGGGGVDRATLFEVLPALVCVAKNLSRPRRQPRHGVGSRPVIGPESRRHRHH